MRTTLSRIGILLGALALTLVAMTGTAMTGTAAAAPAPSTVESATEGAATGASKAVTPLQSGAATDSLPVGGNGFCELFELCLFRLNGFQGSLVDFVGIRNDYIGINYFMWAPGVGEPLANNSQSAFNYDPDLWAIVCTEQQWLGQCGYIPPINGGDFLPDWFLNVESHTFGF